MAHGPHPARCVSLLGPHETSHKLHDTPIDHEDSLAQSHGERKDASAGLEHNPSPTPLNPPSLQPSFTSTQDFSTKIVSRVKQHFVVLLCYESSIFIINLLKNIEDKLLKKKVPDC